MVLGVGVSYYLIPEPQNAWKKFTSPYLNAPQIHQNESVLWISSDDPDSRILYTLNGQDPSLYGKDFVSGIDVDMEYRPRRLYKMQLAVEYLAPFTWDFPYEGCVVRSCSNQNRLGCSKVKNHTVFEKFTKTGLNVVSISIDENEMFDEHKGKTVLGNRHEAAKKINIPWWAWDANFRDDGTSSEVNAGFEFIDGDNGQRIYDTNVLLKIHGNASRAFAQKSMRISDDEYRGDDRIVLPVFKDTVSFNSFNLRNSGNDWGHTMFADAFMHEVAMQMELDVQRGEPVHVLINGHYWGILNLRERFDKRYFKRKYKVNNLATIELDTRLTEGKDSDFKDYSSLLTRLSKLNKEAAYQLLGEEIDIKNFIDYIIIETFFANTDWPKNNVKAYRLDKKDKWKWLIYDMDYGLAYVNNAENKNMFEYLGQSKAYTARLFNFAMTLPEFREQFISSALKYLKSELSEDTLLTIFDEWGEKYKNEIEYQISRWQKPYSVSSWEKRVEENRDFIKARVITYKDHINQL